MIKKQKKQAKKPKSEAVTDEELRRYVCGTVLLVSVVYLLDALHLYDYKYQKIGTMREVLVWAKGWVLPKMHHSYTWVYNC